MQKELFTVTEFLELFSISRTSFYEQVKQGKIRLLKLGKKSLIRRDDAEAWVDALPNTNPENESH